MSKYVHPTNKNSGNIVHNNHYIFTVVNGEVEDLGDGKPYNVLKEHGFERSESVEPETVKLPSSPDTDVAPNQLVVLS